MTDNKFKVRAAGIKNYFPASFLLSFPASINPVINFLKNIVAFFDLREKRLVDLRVFEHICQKIKAVNVGFEAV